MNYNDIDIIKEAKRVFEVEIDALNEMKECINIDFEESIKLITACKGKVIFSGIGKSGHIARKISATMSSLGKASFFLHPAEALHGDLGMVGNEDILIALSYSGESDELSNMLTSIKRLGIPIVSITGSESSRIAQYSDNVILIPKVSEACNLNLAPTSTTTIMLVIGDALAVCASKKNGFKSEDFALFHPQGSIGKKLTMNVSDLMHTGDNNSTVPPLTTLELAIIEMSRKSLGAVCIVDNESRLKGIFTDGDLRRALSNSVNIYNTRIGQIMTKDPICINADDKAILALEIMTLKNISVLPVVSNEKLIGLIRINDILKAGIVI